MQPVMTFGPIAPVSAAVRNPRQQLPSTTTRYGPQPSLSSAEMASQRQSLARCGWQFAKPLKRAATEWPGRHV